MIMLCNLALQQWIFLPVAERCSLCMCGLKSSCAGVSCTAAGFLASCLLRADSRVLCPEAGSLLPLLYGTLRHALTTRAAVLVRHALPSVQRPLPCQCIVAPHLLSASGRLLRLERRQRVRPALGGRAVPCALAAWRQNCSATRGAPRSSCGRSAWCTSRAPRLAGLNGPPSAPLSSESAPPLGADAGALYSFHF